MKVIVATKERSVFDILNARMSVSERDRRSSDDLEPISALTTGRIYSAIPQTQLAIVDYTDLVAHPFSPQLIQHLLEKAPFTVCSSAEFVADPDEYLSGRRSRQRPLPLPSKKVVAFTSYSGGTGKTSIALDTALEFARQTRQTFALPTAMLELTYGASALRALLSLEEAPNLYDLASAPEATPAEFSGVSVYPMDHDQIRLLPTSQTLRYIQQQVSSYVFTVIDVVWPPILLSSIQNEVDLWVVVTTPRIDAVENARRLRQELERDYGENKVIIAVNQMGGLGTSLALMGTHRELELPKVRSNGILFEGRLGREVLTQVYGPLWREMRLHRRRRRLFASRR
jgi:hypothetical protein